MNRNNWLRVLLPSDVGNSYETPETVPPEMLPDIRRTKIAITNYHAFQHRETHSVPKLSHSFLPGNDGRMIITTRRTRSPTVHVGIFPNEGAIIRLVGAVLLEVNDEWQLQHRYMQAEAMTELTPPLSATQSYTPISTTLTDVTPPCPPAGRTFPPLRRHSPGS